MSLFKDFGRSDKSASERWERLKKETEKQFDLYAIEVVRGEITALVNSLKMIDRNISDRNENMRLAVFHEVDYCALFLICSETPSDVSNRFYEERGLVLDSPISMRISILLNTIRQDIIRSAFFNSCSSREQIGKKVLDLAHAGNMQKLIDLCESIETSYYREE